MPHPTRHDKAARTADTRADPASWLFDDSRYQPLTRQLLEAAGLAWQPLTAIRLHLARVGLAGTWHLTTPADGLAASCPRLRRATSQGQDITERETGVLDAPRLCRWCAARLAAPGPEGSYLALVQLILAAGQWVRALEDAAPSAGWLDYARWTARTPFSHPGVVPALIAILPPGPAWAPARSAAQAAWQHLTARAEAAREQARHAAGPPGLRAMAAAACAITGADRQTVAESRLLAAITIGGPWLWPVTYRDAWQLVSSTWLDAIAPDGDHGAAQAALTTAMDRLYAGAPVRDVSLLPHPATTPADEHESPAAWAQTEYQALRQHIAAIWCQRLEAALDSLASDNAGPWRLMLIAGWPLTDDRDRELAYLAHYPELGRILDTGCGAACGRAHESWAVVLHLPGFAARHAAAHDSPHLHVLRGPLVPAETQPDPAQVQAMLHYARELAGNTATCASPLTGDTTR